MMYYIQTPSGKIHARVEANEKFLCIYPRLGSTVSLRLDIRAIDQLVHILQIIKANQP